MVEQIAVIVFKTTLALMSKINFMDNVDISKCPFHNGSLKPSAGNGTRNKDGSLIN